MQIESQPVLTCSKLTIETLEKGVKNVQNVTIKAPERTPGVVLVPLLFTLNIFHTLFCFYI